MNFFNLTPEKLEELRKASEQYKTAVKTAPKTVVKTTPKTAVKTVAKTAPKKVINRAAPKIVAQTGPKVVPKTNPTGPELWTELHLRALKNTGQDERVYLANFGNRIPRYTKGCKCQEFWVNYTRTHPPKYGPNGEFFNYTIEIHNAVNQKLGKPTYTVEQAREYYEKLAKEQ